jgi:hypothetical protein
MVDLARSAAGLFDARDDECGHLSAQSFLEPRRHGGISTASKELLFGPLLAREVTGRTLLGWASVPFPGTRISPAPTGLAYAGDGVRETGLGWLIDCGDHRAGERLTMDSGARNGERLQLQHASGGRAASATLREAGWHQRAFAIKLTGRRTLGVVVEDLPRTT